MDLNEIKKVLYKEKPVARQVAMMRDGGSRKYQADTSLGTINFYVPVADMQGWDGDPMFENQFNEMPAQLLIRWIKLK